jgi:alkylhydroperoxidase/carboxymuconolactone decarboxylase family protein YurZ
MCSGSSALCERKNMGGGKSLMKDFEREELLIRMDERVKTIFNRMQDFDRLFTNHLHHHEMWENDIRTQMRWWVAVAMTAATGSGAMMMGVI